MNQVKRAYFVDGYHGGIKGHMPLGSWADVVRRLERNPDWKLCLDIEPISWEVLRRTDPCSYDAIKRHLLDNDGRVEMVAGSYAQPYGWVIGGESNIRHLIRGKEIIQQHFPGLIVDTYATQEPCWSSSYPQILRSLGYKRAVLKNPGTGWGGYASGTDHETVLWVGPDGSSIPCVPRYACEELLNCWESEAGYMELSFVEKCLARGIAHPVGSFLQDLGWQAQPWLAADYIQNVTWREYMEEIAAKPSRAWHFTQEDIRCTLPWGEGTLQRMSREVRSAEQAVLAAEKLASIASVSGGFSYPAEKLREAWDQLLLSQHHDAWICATTRTGRENWAWQAGAQSWMAELLANEIRDEAIASFQAEAEEHSGSPAHGVRVFNTAGIARKELLEVEIPAAGGTSSILVKDTEGISVPSQIVPTRISPEDGSLYACRLIFEAEVPAMGCRDYVIEHVSRAEQEACAESKGIHAAVFDDHVTITTDLYQIHVDTTKGGVITELYDREQNRSVVSPEAPLHEFAGYVISEERWASSMDSPVSARLKENGPLRVVVEMTGKFADADFITTLSVAKGRRTVDFHTRFHYKQDTWIGDPWEIEPENRSTERRKSHHNTRYKLQARFPVKLSNRKLYKNSAFDVTESRHADTQYERWDEIKHNIILDWVDIYDERLNSGLAIFCDHTTDYSHGENDPLALTLGWGGEAGFWWGRRPLRDAQEMRYAVLPHCDRWDQAGVPRQSRFWTEPLLPVPVRLAGKPSSSKPLLQVTDPSVEVSSLQRDGEDILARLYNAGSCSSSFSVIIGPQSGEVALVELDGKPKERLIRNELPGGGSEVKLSLPRHGLVTLRIADI